MTCTTVLKNASNQELGRTVKTFSNDMRTITTTDHYGQTLIKTFNESLTVMTAILKNSSNVEIARLVKTFSNQYMTITSTVMYQ